MNTNTLLFQNAKYVFLNPTDQWKDIATAVKDTTGVYALVNKVNGKVYIGSSINLYYRLRDYYASWYITTYPDLLISKAIVKYGFINFAILILEVTDKDSTLKAEQHHLDMFKPEYNLLKQAGRPVGYKHTEESKAKMRARHLERVWGDNVKVTDTSTGKIISYKSIRTAAKAMSCSQNTIAKYNKSGKLYKSRYLIQVISNPRSSPLV